VSGVLLFGATRDSSAHSNGIARALLARNRPLHEPGCCSPHTHQSGCFRIPFVRTLIMENQAPHRSVYHAGNPTSSAIGRCIRGTTERGRERERPRKVEGRPTGYQISPAPPSVPNIVNYRRNLVSSPGRRDATSRNSQMSRALRKPLGSIGNAVQTRRHIVPPSLLPLLSPSASATSGY